jgi:hypothetical protein
MSLAQRASRHDGRRRPRSWPSLTVMLVAGLTAALVGGVGVTAGAVVNPNPTFSRPTSITNPLFPQSRLEQVITLGVDTGEPLRYELTRLPGSKTITVNGKSVQALKVQFLATSDSAVLEVADDYFAQADDGTVWYLGEHVSNYEDGVLVDNDGTWVSGEKRPDGKLYVPGPLVLGKPQVGDVYNPENNKPFVFEQVTVKQTGLTVTGPRGRVSGAIKVREDLLDGSSEEKVYAPGYGEFSAKAPFGSAKPDEEVAVALAAPIDQVGGETPSVVDAMSEAADDIFDAVGASNFKEADRQLAELTDAWDAHRATLTASRQVPKLIAEMDDAIGTLEEAVAARSRAKALPAAAGMARTVPDLELRFDKAAEVDLERLDAWARQALAAAATKDVAGERSASVVLDATWARVRHTVSADPRGQITTQLSDLRKAARSADHEAVKAAAKRLRATLDTL